MTKEQEDSIKMLENTDISTIELAENVDLYTYNIAVKNVLNILKEQDIEIEKKDKIIDLMARAIDNYDSQLAINTFRDKEYVKEYFAGLVKKE